MLFRSYGMRTCVDVTPVVALWVASSKKRLACGASAFFLSFCERKGAVMSGAMDVPSVKKVWRRMTGVAAASPQVAIVSELQAASKTCSIKYVSS